jgi:hypothetical protein
LQQVEAAICKLEEALSLERQQNVIKDVKNDYNKQTLLQTRQEFVSQAPLALMPLQELKKRTKKESREAQINSSTSAKKSSGIRHSFYPIWLHGIERVKEFAAQNGFWQVPLVSDDSYATISVYWRQRELVVSCDSKGMINHIRHRSVRWCSVTFKRFKEEGGDDVRCYLETRAPLQDDEDGDESALETIIDIIDGSVFTNEFLQEIKLNEEIFTSKPLVPKMFDFNWRFRSMRRITPVLKFTNKEKDVFLLHQINDGMFRAESLMFEWFPQHNEFEMRLSMNRNDAELCKKSFDMSMKLFDFTKK